MVGFRPGWADMSRILAVAVPGGPEAQVVRRGSGGREEGQVRQDGLIHLSVEGGSVMASENVIGMLWEKGAPFTIEELRAMPDAECWKWLYKNFPPKPRDKRPQVCFTGHTPDEKARLKEIAGKGGYRTVTSVTKRLAILCTGETPGPSKLMKAAAQDVQVLTTQEFVAQLQSRET